MTYIGEKTNPGTGQTFDACRLCRTTYFKARTAAHLLSGTASSILASRFFASVLNGKTAGSARSLDVHGVRSFRMN